MLTAAEKTSILETWNDTAEPLGSEPPLPHLFERHVRAAPAAPALVFEKQTISYGDLNARANRLAHASPTPGNRRGQTVALSMPRCPEAIVAVLAAWKIGAPYLYLDPLYPINRILGMMQDAHPAVLMASAAMAGVTIPTVCLPLNPADLASETSANLDLAIGADDLAYIIYTSGSTGRPKGTVLRHRGLTNLRLAQAAVFGPKPADRVLQYASLSFDASVFEMAMAFGSGAALVLGTHNSLMPGCDLLNLLRDQRVTIATLPPSVPALLPPTPLPDLHTLIVAGEACSAEVVSVWGQGRRLFNAYGPTEATVWSTVALSHRRRPDAAHWPTDCQHPCLHPGCQPPAGADRCAGRALLGRRRRSGGLSQSTGVDRRALPRQSILDGRRGRHVSHGRSGTLAGERRDRVHRPARLATQTARLSG